MRRNLPDLFIDLLAKPSADFISQEAYSFFDSYLSLFSELGLLIPGVHRTWTHCLNCGQTHEVTDIGDVYWLVCPDDGVEAVAINADQLKTVRFSQQKFYSWLQSQFALQGNVEAFDDKVLLGQGTVNGEQRLFIFSYENSTQARENLSQSYLASQPVILYLSTDLDNHNQGFDINLADYLNVQENSLTIGVSSAMSVVADSIQATSDSLFAFELVEGDDGIIMTGSILGRHSLPLFGSNKSALFRILSTLLKIHEAYAPAVQFPHPFDAVASQHQAKKDNELEKTDLVKSRQLLNTPGKELMSLLLSKDYQAGKTVFTFRRAITQAEYDGLSIATKGKIVSALGNLPDSVNT